LSRPFPSRTFASASSFVRVNGKIRAREVRVIGINQQQLGIFPLAEAISMARANGVDLVEIAPTATPPVCRLVDYGKFRYEQAKKDKEAKKHQHANKVKEIQLSASINAHDLEVKLTHAIDFLCEEMKVKISLKFRGREMAHQEYGFQVVQNFISSIAPYGHPDAPPKLIGKGITTMVSPLPRNKRAKNPRAGANSELEEGRTEGGESPAIESKPKDLPKSNPVIETNSASGSFGSAPFSKLDLEPRKG